MAIDLATTAGAVIVGVTLVVEIAMDSGMAGAGRVGGAKNPTLWEGLAGALSLLRDGRSLLPLPKMEAERA